MSAGPGAAPTPEARSGGGMRDTRTRSRCTEPRREHPGRDAGPPRPPSAETAPRQGQRGAGPGAEPPPRTLIPGARQPRLPRGRWSVSPAPAVRDRMPHGGSNNRASASQSPGARGLRPGPAPPLCPQSWLLPTSSRGPALWVRPASMSSFLLRRTQSCWVRAPSPQRPPFTLISSLKVQAPRTVHRRCWELGRESMNLGDGHKSPSRRK